MQYGLVYSDGWLLSSSQLQPIGFALTQGAEEINPKQKSFSKKKSSCTLVDAHMEINMKAYLYSILVLASLSPVLCHSAPDPAAPAAKSPGGKTEDVTQNLAPNGTIEELMSNLSLGIAVIGFTKPEIVSATIENKFVRVTEKRSMRAGPWLQTGYVWPGNKNSVGYGFFVGAEVLSGNKLINAVGIGPLIQIKRGSDKDGKKPINLGFGLQWSTMQVLGNGIEEDKEVPSGTEAIRFKTITRPGVVVNFSMDL